MPGRTTQGGESTIFWSDRLRERIAAAEIHADIYGSDHCPVSLTLREA